MIINEPVGIHGHVKLTARDKYTGRIVAIIETKNLVLTTGKVLAAQLFCDEDGYDTGLTYCAEGTDATAAAIGQTKLVAEAARKAIDSKVRVDNVVTYSTFFPASDCPHNIKEVAIFGHSTASSTADSGVAFARALLSYDNSLGLVDLTIDWAVTFG